MTGTVTSEGDRLARVRLYRRLMIGFVLAGVVGGLAGRSLGYPLLGEGLYWLGIVGFLAVWWGSSLTLFDERDRALERRASAITLMLVAPVFVAGASAVRVLSVLDLYATPPELVGALYEFVGLYAVFAGVYLWLRYRP